MALQQTSYLSFILALLLLRIGATLGKMECEELPVEVCAFSVASSGARCVLENRVLRDGSLQYECQSSIVMAQNFVEWVETEECINACGLERMSVGLSTDSLVETDLTQMLCSPECRDNCPNIFHLYTKLAAGEGVHLPHVCEAQRMRSRKLIGGARDQFSWASKSVNTIDPSTASGPASSSTLQSQGWAAAPASSPAASPN